MYSATSLIIMINIVKAKHLLNTNHFEIHRHYNNTANVYTAQSKITTKYI